MSILSGPRTVGPFGDLPTRRGLAPEAQANLKPPVSPPDLAAFLRAEQRRGFSWTGASCLLLPADWMVACGLPDPAAPWRDRIADEDAARTLLASAGGVRAFAVSAMAPTGALRIPTHAVRRGDVGVVRLRGPEGEIEAGAVCTGPRWAVRSRRAVWIGQAEPLEAWALEAGGLAAPAACAATEEG
jgi:hypothetical protein